MSGGGRGGGGWAGRFPGFYVLDQVRHWDRATADVVLARTDTPAAVKFFTESEESCARALLNLLTGQGGQDGELAVPVLEMIDSRLAAGETDGWRYADMPEDGQAWRDTLVHLDADAYQRFGTPFADVAQTGQLALIQAVQDLKSADWHGLPAAHVWSLWTRYACTAFYAHPFAWAEIGFPG
ncbi:MAG TPA: gluconate 2-dehydrogenase subunit 3 family protein, partial [Streptosporangiaceae bacterium]|nr:gluconate 2-dehydrogenase subunit 3 family protein [Streptosporangiaceae bacterium]